MGGYREDRTVHSIDLADLTGRLHLRGKDTAEELERFIYIDCLCHMSVLASNMEWRASSFESLFGMSRVEVSKFLSSGSGTL